MSNVLLCKNISKYYTRNNNFFKTKEEKLFVLNQLSFAMKKGETLGLVGPSGCGKSTLARIVTGLMPPSEGEVFIDDTPMNSFNDYIGKVQIVFQNPFSSLNPKLKISYSIQEPLLLKYKRENTSCTKESLIKEVEGILLRVGLKKEDAQKFPHEFSGGQRQRIAIARAIIAKPSLLVCDEAVSALDVSIQAQILNLLKDLKEEDNLSLLFISHDLNVINTMSDSVLELKVLGQN